MKTKGALIWEYNQPWTIEEIDIGDPVKDEVKIQMEASGMCHSDHHLVTGHIPMAGFPVLGGHEGAGIVTEVGPGVENVAPGDHVVLSFIPSCVRPARAANATCATWEPACSVAPPSRTEPTG
jgi:S-(hydroxymethyl)glutathione dehydrogenase/alcohol dehydrogenase